MAFSSVFAYVVLFSVVMSLLLAMFISTNADILQAHQVTIDNLDSEIEKARTEITITNATVNGTIANITCRNTGRRVIDTDCLDLFLDSKLMERTGLDIIILNTTWQPTLWDPDEYLRIITNSTLDSAKNYTVSIVTCKGVTETDTIYGI